MAMTGFGGRLIWTCGDMSNRTVKNEYLEGGSRMYMPRTESNPMFQ